MREKLHIEELFRTRFEGSELSPSPASWKAIQRKLRWKQFMRFRAGRFNIYYAGAVLLAGIGIVWLLTVEKKPSEPGVPEELSTTVSTDEEMPGAYSDEAARISRSENSSENKSKEMQAGAPDQGKQNDGEASKDTASRVDDISLHEDDQEALLNSTAAPIIHAEPETDPPDQGQAVAHFTSSTRSGCAPLTVQFTDQSINASSHYWDFGTGETSRDQHPVYEFREAGRFVVTLTTENHGSLPTVSRMMIEILAAPVADFQIEEGLVGMDNHVVLNLVNFSSDGSAYAWDLVDEECSDCSDWSSSEQQPALELKAITPDSRSVRLQVVNEHGCTDTAIQELPLVVESSLTRIKFPNAFSPNPSGPGTGSFAPGSRRIDLFHPVYIEVPAEFHMRIFTRRGELVFESHDIYRGWDGYQHQEAATADVYVWMVEGKWKDGEPFSLHGDVTLVRNQYW